MRTRLLLALAAFGIVHSAIAQPGCTAGYQPDSGFIGAGDVTQFPTPYPVTHAGIPFDFDGPGPQSARFVVGGLFNSMDGVPARSVAAWDGREWHAIGNGLAATGILDGVTSLCVHNGELFAAGRFSINNDTATMPLVAKWNGAAWIQVGSVFQGSVITLASFNGDLYAGGQFTTNLLPNVAKWNGTAWTGYQWSNTGPGASNSRVEAMTVHQGALLIGGTFPMRVATFDGTNPAVPFGLVAGGPNCNFGCSGGVSSLLSVGTDLYIAGDFRLWPSNAQPGVMKFDGTAWTQMTFNGNPTAKTVASYNGSLYLCSGGTTGSGSFARWTGTQWAAVDSFQWFAGTLRTFEFLGEYGGKAVIGGHFGGIMASLPLMQTRWMRCIATFDGNNYAPVTRGPDARTTVFLPWGNETLAVGRFRHVGGQVADRIAIRGEDGYWRPFAAGPQLSDDAWCATMYQDQLIVGGSFLSAGGVSVNRVARWTGSAWADMGGATINTFPSFLGVVNGQLWMATTSTAGSLFSGYDTLSVWNGTAWQARPVLPQMRRLTIHNGEIFAHAAGQWGTKVYRWSGAAWDALPVPSNEMSILILGRKGGSLYGYGRKVYRWTGTDWAFADDLPSSTVLSGLGHDDTESDGLMYVSSNAFTSTASESVMSWDGESWGTQGPMPLNPITNWGVTSQSLRAPALYARDGEVLIGGAFLYLDQNRTRSGSFYARASDEWRPRTVSAPPRYQSGLAGLDLSLSWIHTGSVTNYTWYKDGVILTNGQMAGVGLVQGAQTPTLVVHQIETGGGGRYWCVARNACGAVTLSPRTVHVQSLCDPDFNADTLVNAADITALELAIGGDNQTPNDPDFNLDGSLDGFDVETLAGVIAGGPCP